MSIDPRSAATSGAGMKLGREIRWRRCACHRLMSIAPSGQKVTALGVLPAVSVRLALCPQ